MNRKALLLIALALCALLVPAAVLSETRSGSCGENVTWTLDDDGVLTVSGTGDITSKPWWDIRDDVRRIVVEDGVTGIMDRCFYMHDSLTDVTVAGTVKTIGEEAFSYNDSLTVVTLGSGVTTIGAKAFKHCPSLTSVPLPSTLTAIGAEAFQESPKLASAVIPEGVTRIEGYTFYKCTALKSVSIPDGLEEIGEHAFGGCSSLTALKVPKVMRRIAGSAFSGSGLTSFAFPEGVISIEQYSFDGCSSLVSVTIPEGVKYVNTAAFRNCSSLKSIKLPDSVASLGDWTFWGCTALSSVTLSESLSTLNIYTFRDCDSLTSITIPASLTRINSDAFFLSGLKSVTVASACNTAAIDFFEDKGIPVTTGPHTHVKTDAAVPATCTEPGLTEGSHCAWCDVVITEQQTVPALGHDWNKTVYTWAEDLSAVTAKRVCRRDGAHTETETAAVSAAISKKPTLKAAGKKTYTCAAFKNTAFRTQKKTAVLPAAVTAVFFPDAAFRAYVSARIDTDGDGYLTADEIAAVAKISLLKADPVEKLNGIGFFTALENLNVSGHKLKKLDLSKNTALKVLNVSGNQLAGLDLTANINLTKLTCKSNVRSIAVKGGLLDVTTLGLSPDKITKVSGAALKDGVLTILKPGTVTYTYDCGGFKASFKLNVTASRVGITSAVPKKASWAYTGEAIEPAMTVKAKVNGKLVTLKAGQYKAVYKNNVKAGTASVTVTGTGFFKGSVTASFKITRVSLKSASLEYTKAAFTGKALKPAATVKASVGGRLVTLVKGTDFTVKYTNNTEKGTATVTIKGKGNFTGTITKTFIIK